MNNMSLAIVRNIAYSQISKINKKVGVKSQTEHLA